VTEMHRVAGEPNASRIWLLGGGYHVQVEVNIAIETMVKSGRKYKGDRETSRVCNANRFSIDFRT
jgi:hypothetical protein